MWNAPAVGLMMLLRIILATLLLSLAAGCKNTANTASDEDKGKGPTLYDLGDD
jgi:hypothetical protein